MRGNFMRGIMNIRNLSLYSIVALMAAGATGAWLRAQDRTVPYTTSSAEAGRWYELAMKEREDLLFVDKGVDSMREAVKRFEHHTAGAPPQIAS